MIEKSKFYIIIFLILIVSGISILLIRNYYINMNSISQHPALVLNTVVNSQHLQSMNGLILKENKQHQSVLLQKANDSTQKILQKIATQSEIIQREFQSIYNEFVEYTGGYDPHTGYYINRADTELSTKYWVTLGNGERLKQKVDAYVNTLPFEAMSPMLDSRELEEIITHQYPSAFDAEWFNTVNSSQLLFQNLPLEFCVEQLFFIQFQCTLLESAIYTRIEMQLIKHREIKGITLKE